MALRYNDQRFLRFTRMDGGLTNTLCQIGNENGIRLARVCSTGGR